MNGSPISAALTFTEWAICLFAAVVVSRQDKDRVFGGLRLLLASRAVANLVLAPLALFGGHLLEKHLAYEAYFYVYWTDFTLEAVLNLFIVYSLFNQAMAPLGGIKDLGRVVFRWAGAVSVAMTVAVILVPNPSELAYVTRMLTEFQRAQGVLTLSLLLFVCSAIRPLGLTMRSRSFGVILCLSILAATTLVSSGWLAYSKQMYSVVNDAKSVVTCIALLLCGAYFRVSEPKRRMIILPTTSPYLHWNRVAEVLGDPPGFVAIAGVPPEMFAPAEIEVMKRASRMMVAPVFPLTSLTEKSRPQIA